MSAFVSLRTKLLLTTIFLLLVACESDQDQGPGPVREPVDRTAPIANPLESSYDTPLGVPPFHEIRAEHFRPALEKALERAAKRISEITDNPAEPDFDNTIHALEKAGREAARIVRLWYGLSAVGDEAAEEADSEVLTQLLNDHQHRILRNRALFARIEAVRGGTDLKTLEAEQQRLVEITWHRFRRAGAHLDKASREKLAELDHRIARLDRLYAETRRSATHRHELLVQDESRLDGLPESLVTLAQRSARDRGHIGSWAFTLHAHSFYPFMRHFSDRAAREELYRAWMARYRDVTRKDEDLGRLIEQLARLRAERAELLNFDSHLDFLLDDAAMADRATLERLIERLASAAREKAEEETERLSELAASDGMQGDLRPWDWWYYRERLLESAYELDQSSMREHFEISRVRDGLFMLANKLWGLTFQRRSDLPAWHMDADAFEVRDADGSTLGVLYFDPIHRRGKLGGGWTSTYRAQHRRDGERIAPVTAVVTNVTPAAAKMPALLSTEQVRTVSHEFGHALHNLLSDVDHAALAGTNVATDFVEFPALLLERWMLAPGMLSNYARHHRTGEALDDRAVEALQAQGKLTAGLETLELLAAIELDLALHGVPAGEVPDLETAEKRVREKLDLPAFVSPRHHGGGLASVFASQRSGGDFRTLWSRLLAADAFAAFEAAGLTDRELAGSLRDEILSRGSARDPADSWRAFRDRSPDARYLLDDLGLVANQLEEKTPSGE
ncbi:MAG: M3 family metallopeptidase [Wenzhouxiangella sp.]|jgi:peptidyl-dipeptidase Dcp|nr:M3 family metallopeptidase [Wenzhouxiangella sp.]